MVKVNYGQLSGQASSTSSATQGRVSGYQLLISSFTDFSGAPDLTGSAYNAAKNYATGTMTAFYQACILYAEAVVDAANKLSDSYANYCGGEDLDETQLRAEIESANRGCLSLSASISGLESKKKKTAKDNSRLAELRNQVAQAEEQIRTTQEKLNHLLAFDGESASANSDADSLKTTVETAASEIENSFSDGGFSVPADSTWRTTVSGLWAQRAQNLENAYQVALTKLQKGENLTEADLTAIERYNTEHPGKVDQAVMDQVKALRSERADEVEIKSILDKVNNQEDLSADEVQALKDYNEKYPNGSLKSEVSVIMDAYKNWQEESGNQSVEEFSKWLKGKLTTLSYASTFNVAIKESVASAKKIKGGTWYGKSVKSTKSGYKTWRQVSGDVNRFKAVKNAKKADEVINGTGKIIKGKGVKGAAKSVGALGGSLAVLDGGLTYLERKDEYGQTSAIVDGVAHTGTALGSIYVGAAVGSAIPIPVVGTVAGAAAGYLVGGIANTVYDGFAHGKWDLSNFALW